MAFVNIDLDLHILFCTFLHPSDILTLRKTCKALQLVTRRRIIWVDALRRVCLENMLFLPSFPILDMTDMELERAAIAPRRWIELSTSFAARGLGDPGARLSLTATRIIDNPLSRKRISRLILVPGGRYMVAFSLTGLGVWDLGYTSSADCELIASVGPEGGAFHGDIHATPDGMGLVIFSHRSYIRKAKTLSLLESLALIHSLEDEEIILTVWDYRLNASVSFVALIDVEEFGLGEFEDYGEVVATQTAIILLYKEEIFIWAIPPLLPQPPNFDDYSLTQFPPVIRVKLPDGLALYPSLIKWGTMSSWYFDPSKPLYFDKIYSRSSQSQCFKLIIKPDLSDATLHFINTIQLLIHDFGGWEAFFKFMFCEDNLVYRWSSSYQFGTYTGSTLSRPTLHRNPSLTKISLPVLRPREFSVCPASGRFVHLDCGPDADRIRVLDFLPHQRL